MIRSETNSVYALSFMQRMASMKWCSPYRVQASLQLLQPGEQLKRLRRRSIENPKSQKSRINLQSMPNRQNRISHCSIPTEACVSHEILTGRCGLFLGLLVSGIIYFMLPEPEPVQLPQTRKR